jgi:hypothetical protein
MNTIVINGTTITGGRNITVSNGRVTIDGKDVTPNQKNISITVHGSVESISADACSYIEVVGAAGKVNTMSGDVKCGAVLGSVKTMSGDVTCGAVSGDVETMSGDINRN